MTSSSHSTDEMSSKYSTIIQDYNDKENLYNPVFKCEVTVCDKNMSMDISMEQIPQTDPSNQSDTINLLSVNIDHLTDSNTNIPMVSPHKNIYNENQDFSLSILSSNNNHSSTELTNKKQRNTVSSAQRAIHFDGKENYNSADLLKPPELIGLNSNTINIKTFKQSPQKTMYFNERHNLSVSIISPKSKNKENASLQSGNLKATNIFDVSMDISMEENAGPTQLSKITIPGIVPMNQTSINAVTTQPTVSSSENVANKENWRPSTTNFMQSNIQINNQIMNKNRDTICQALPIEIESVSLDYTKLGARPKPQRQTILPDEHILLDSPSENIHYNQLDENHKTAPEKYRKTILINESICTPDEINQNRASERINTRRTLIMNETLSGNDDTTLTMPNVFKNLNKSINANHKSISPSDKSSHMMVGNASAYNECFKKRQTLIANENIDLSGIEIIPSQFQATDSQLAKFYNKSILMDMTTSNLQYTNRVHEVQDDDIVDMSQSPLLINKRESFVPQRCTVNRDYSIQNDDLCHEKENQTQYFNEIEGVNQITKNCNNELKSTTICQNETIKTEVTTTSNSIHRYQQSKISLSYEEDFKMNLSPIESKYNFSKQKRSTVFHNNSIQVDNSRKPEINRIFKAEEKNSIDMSGHILNNPKNQTLLQDDSIKMEDFMMSLSPREAKTSKLEENKRSTVFHNNSIQINDTVPSNLHKSNHYIQNPSMKWPMEEEVQMKRQTILYNSSIHDADKTLPQLSREQVPPQALEKGVKTTKRYTMYHNETIQPEDSFLPHSNLYIQKQKSDLKEKNILKSSPVAIDRHIEADHISKTLYNISLELEENDFTKNSSCNQKSVKSQINNNMKRDTVFHHNSILEEDTLQTDNNDVSFSQKIDEMFLSPLLPVENLKSKKRETVYNNESMQIDAAPIHQSSNSSTSKKNNTNECKDLNNERRTNVYHNDTMEMEDDLQSNLQSERLAKQDDSYCCTQQKSDMISSPLESYLKNKNTVAKKSPGISRIPKRTTLLANQSMDQSIIKDHNDKRENHLSTVSFNTPVNRESEKENNNLMKNPPRKTIYFKANDINSSDIPAEDLDAPSVQHSLPRKTIDFTNHSQKSVANRMIAGNDNTQKRKTQYLNDDMNETGLLREKVSRISSQDDHVEMLDMMMTQMQFKKENQHGSMNEVSLNIQSQKIPSANITNTIKQCSNIDVKEEEEDETIQHFPDFPEDDIENNSPDDSIIVISDSSSTSAANRSTERKAILPDEIIELDRTRLYAIEENNDLLENESGAILVTASDDVVENSYCAYVNNLTINAANTISRITTPVVSSNENTIDFETVYSRVRRLSTTHRLSLDIPCVNTTCNSQNTTSAHLTLVDEFLENIFVQNRNCEKCRHCQSSEPLDPDHQLLALKMEYNINDFRPMNMKPLSNILEEFEKRMKEINNTYEEMVQQSVAIESPTYYGPERPPIEVLLSNFEKE